MKSDQHFSFFGDVAHRQPRPLPIAPGRTVNWREDPPGAVVCVDFYGFNRRVLSLAKSARIPAFYFISPQVWASRPGRVAQLRRLVNRMLVIFPPPQRQRSNSLRKPYQCLPCRIALTSKNCAHLSQRNPRFLRNFALTEFCSRTNDGIQ